MGIGELFIKSYFSKNRVGQISIFFGFIFSLKLIERDNFELILSLISFNSSIFSLLIFMFKIFSILFRL